MGPKLIIIYHLCWWLWPLGSAVLLPQSPFQAHLSNHCCSAAGTHSSDPSAVQQVSLSQGCTGVFAVQRRLEKQTFYPASSVFNVCTLNHNYLSWFTLMSAQDCNYTISLVLWCICLLQREISHLVYQQQTVSQSPLFLSCCQILTVLLLFWHEGSSSLQATASGLHLSRMRENCSKSSWFFLETAKEQIKIDGLTESLCENKLWYRIRSHFGHNSRQSYHYISLLLMTTFCYVYMNRGNFF